MRIHQNFRSLTVAARIDRTYVEYKMRFLWGVFHVSKSDFGLSYVYNGLANFFFRLLMKTIGIFLMILLVSLQYKLWIGDTSLSQWAHLEEKVAAQEKKNDLLSAQNRALEADIIELKSGDQSLEEQARYEMGMIKDGEVYYQFTD